MLNIIFMCPLQFQNQDLRNYV
jgi:uncharacterized membrane protein YgcG